MNANARSSARLLGFWKWIDTTVLASFFVLCAHTLHELYKYTPFPLLRWQPHPLMKSHK
jgi:hypothetical protein